MNKIALISDSSCCLNSKECAEFGVLDVLPMHIHANDKEYDCNGDWTMFDPKDYYNSMREGTVYKSSQVNKEQYKKSFKKFLDEGYDILSVSCTSALSASVKESYKARDELKDLYPLQKIICIDTNNSTFCLGMILREAGKLVKEGMEIEKIAKWIEDNMQFYNEVGTVDKLNWLRMAGRVSASAAFFGGLLSVKPIVVYDEVGHNVAVEKVKGRSKSLQTCADYIKKYADVKKDNTIRILHADALDDAMLLGKMLEDMFSEKLDISYGYVEPGVGSSVGPGTLICHFYGSPEIRKLNK